MVAPSLAKAVGDGVVCPTSTRQGRWHLVTTATEAGGIDRNQSDPPIVLVGVTIDGNDVIAPACRDGSGRWGRLLHDVTPHR